MRSCRVWERDWMLPVSSGSFTVLTAGRSAIACRTLTFSSPPFLPPLRPKEVRLQPAMVGWLMMMIIFLVPSDA